MVNDFPRTLSLLRQEKKISQRKAAAELQVSQALLSHYENGVREPGLSFVVRAADYYGVSCDYLLGRTLSREGTAVAAEDLPDSSAKKDNVLKGSAMAMLSKKLQVNGISALYGALGNQGSKEAILASSAYLSLAFYKVYRTLYCADPNHTPGAFPLEENGWRELCDAAMKQQERRLRRLAQPVPGLTNQEMQQAAPSLAPSLFTMLHNASEMMEKLDLE